MSADHEMDADHSGPAPARRAVLGVAGLAALAGGWGGSAQRAHAAPGTDEPSRRVHVAHTVAELTGWRSRRLDDGTVAVLLGHAEAGDGGERLVRYDAGSRATPNGGTVLVPTDLAGSPDPKRPPKRSGRWLTLHNGTADFRWFGVFGAETPADDALDALVADRTIARIEAHTNLNFVRRHRFARSHVVIDFGGNTVTTEGIEPADRDDPFAAVMCFRGTVSDEVISHTLTTPMPELRDDYQVADADAFEIGDWYALQVDALAGQWERELQRLVQVTERVDDTRVRVNHKVGWPLDAGRKLTWRRVDPVEQVHIRNLNFVGVAGGDQYSGSHPIAFEYAVRCDVENVHGVATFWPVVMRRWSTHFTTRGCSLVNPASVTWGGAGYLTQQIYCNYGHVVDCHTSNARHLNDWTASSYGLVENCHGDGDDQGPFVTHGQYEHDLSYVGNSGLMTFANSGAAWGGSATRITVMRHVCSWFVARVKVTDLTLQDVQVVRKEGLAGSGMLWINADGAQLRGCRADDTVIISQASTRSGRPTVVSDCEFSTLAGDPVIQDTVSRPVHLVRTTLRGLDAVAFAGQGSVVLDDCRLQAAEDAGSLTVTGDLTINGGSADHVQVTAAGDRPQTIRLRGVALAGSPAGGAFLRRGTGEALVRWELDAVTAEARDDVSHATILTGPNQWSALGCRFTGGSLDLAPDAFAGNNDSYVRHTGNVEHRVTRRAFPDQGPRALLEPNLTL